MSISLKDSFTMNDSLGKILDLKMKGGPQRTKIIIKDHNTGEILQVLENKILLPASQDTACKQFGLTPKIKPSTYNKDLNLQNTINTAVDPKPNEPIVCLWCAGRSGCGASPNEVIAVTAGDRINPKNDIIPFRYVMEDNDISKDMRKIYFGRAIDDSTGWISYYFKSFESDPVLNIKFADGTEVTDDIYSIETSQQIDIYVEMKLSITRLDFRDYFDHVLGWDNADISTISLVTAWYDDTIEGGYKWYQDIIPFSKLNFRTEQLRDLNRAIDFDYQIYY